MQLPNFLDRATRTKSRQRQGKRAFTLEQLESRALLAASLTVINANDSGMGSLRETIQKDTMGLPIVVPLTLGAINLQSALSVPAGVNIDFNNDTVDAPSEGDVFDITSDGSNASTTFSNLAVVGGPTTSTATAFNVAPGATLVLNGVEVEYMKVGIYIQPSGSASLQGSDTFRNITYAAIQDLGSLSTAGAQPYFFSDTGQGAVVVQGNGVAGIEGAAFYEDVPAISMSGAALTVNKAQIGDSSASATGSGVINVTAGNVKITNSEIDGVLVGSAIFDTATNSSLTLDNDYVFDSQQTAITVGVNLTVTGTTVTDNAANAPQFVISGGQSSFDKLWMAHKH